MNAVSKRAGLRGRLAGALFATVAPCTGLGEDAVNESPAALTATEVLASSEAHFPQILQSLARRRGADGKLLEADGAFDVVFAADGFSRLSGYYDGTVVQGGARKNLGPLGAQLYAGYKLSDGDFPVYEDINYTNAGGELKVGMLFSLLRDRDIDEQRFGQADARLAIQQADLDVLLTKIGVQQRALVAYWRWIAAGRQLGVYENLLKIAEDREAGLQEQVRRGARAEIFLVENRQNITRRRTLTTRARRDFQLAANALSFYYRDDTGATLVPGRSRLPPPPPAGSIADLSVGAGAATSAALSRRPELQLLRTAIERAQKRIELANNSLKPRLDLNVAVDQDFGAIANGGPSRDGTDTIVGFSFSVPLQQRKEKGKLWQEEARVEAMQHERRLQEEQIELQVSNILLDLDVAEDLVRLAEQLVEQTEIVRAAEQRRFDSGASDFFLVNVREETAANARIQYFQAELERHIARANYDAATVDLSRLGISDAD